MAGQTETKAMSNSVKSKFAGLFRGLFGRTDGPEATSSASTATRPVTNAAPASNTVSAPAAKKVGSHPAGQPASLPASADEIALPLAPIVAGLPMELRAKMMSVPPAGMTINVAMETIVSQLAFGAVKISFGELRQLTAGLFANSGGEHDIKMISLPLNEILPRLKSTLLTRNSQPKVEVDETIKGPFNGGARGVNFTAQPLRAGAPAQLPPKKDADSSPDVSRVNPPPMPISPLTAPGTPIAFTPMPSHGRPPVSLVPANGNGHHPLPSATPPPVPPKPVIKFSAAPALVPPASAPAPAPVASRIEPAQPTIRVALWDLAENWPEALKQEIHATALADRSIVLAGDFVAAGLKRGRVTMTWKDVRALAKPNSAVSVNDGLELDLPLKVIAPLFFAVQKNLQRPARKSSVSGEIPNLFFGFPQPAPEAPAPALDRPVERKHSESNFYVWDDTNEMVTAEESVFTPPPVPHTDFTSRQAQPKEIVARAMALPGVAGVVVALPDGLRVASEMAADLNADTMAAFVPQIFERMNQSAKELRMGPLGNVTFTVGNVPWRIYRVNAVYLAAFGRPGESLPAVQLASLAGELVRKK